MTNLIHPFVCRGHVYLDMNIAMTSKQRTASEAAERYQNDLKMHILTQFSKPFQYENSKNYVKIIKTNLKADDQNDPTNGTTTDLNR